MVFAGRTMPEEENRVRLTLPDRRFQVGRCPDGCINLGAPDLLCNCGKHKLPQERERVVHLMGWHWDAVCAFEQLLKSIGDLSTRL